MRSHDADKLARRDHLGLLPELRKMARVAGHQAIGARGIGALDESIAVAVLRHLERAQSLDRGRTVAKENSTLFRAPAAGGLDLADEGRRLVNAHRSRTEALFGSARGGLGAGAGRKEPRDIRAFLRPLTPVQDTEERIWRKPFLRCGWRAR